ncbi:Thioesterase poxG [Exophiala dermatitidis]
MDVAFGKLSEATQAVVGWISQHILASIGVALLLTSVKNIPLMWHTRLISAVLYHTKAKSADVVTTEKNGPLAVFQPIVTSSRSGLYECDINGHKSDSTYFSDLDINRIHLISKLFKGALNPALLPADKRRRARKMRVLLGGAACMWRKEIKPFVPYEIHTRVLAWEGKWIYLISHFVPVQSSRKRSNRASRDKANSEDVDAQVLASSVSKYVFKDGRKTVEAAVALESIGLLPAEEGEDNGDRARIEEERQKGMKTARHFIALDEMHNQFHETLSKPSFGEFGMFGRFVFH